MHVDIAIGHHELGPADVEQLCRCFEGVDLDATVRLDLREVNECSKTAAAAITALAAIVADHHGTFEVVHAAPAVKDALGWVAAPAAADELLLAS